MKLLDALDQSREDFVWKDGERLIAFGGSALASLPGFLRAAQMEEYSLLYSVRALEIFQTQVDADSVTAGAAALVPVGAGQVAQLARDLREQAGDRPILAIGGGRVIDVAKAIAGTYDQRVAAIPTTLSGAPMTGVHRLPAGFAGQARTVRPSIVIGIPDLMASQNERLRTGSAMNALSHAIESLFVETGSAVPRLAGARAVKLMFRSLLDDAIDEPTRRLRLSLGAIEAGYAVGATGYALHHVICQTIVRLADVPHAPTYGVMLPFTLEFYKLRDELTWSLICEAMGTQDPSVMIARACEASGNPTTLTQLGVAPERIDGIVATASERRELQLTPGGVTADDIRSIIESAL
ncbi:MAG: iron-containing alcohol dehydrogenase [Thermoleophilaceae bacterium]|nr:iron-containing alcohol dehydrogenase [Thermoleophilaceae bacterium]